MTMMALFPLLTFLLLLTTVFADETCAADGTCDDSCQDLLTECQFWAGERQCEENPDFMLRECPKSCNACDKDIEETLDEEVVEEKEEDEFGVVQLIDKSREEEIMQALEDMKVYFDKAREDPTAKMREILDNCKNKHEACAFWKVLGECEAVRTKRGDLQVTAGDFQ